MKKLLNTLYVLSEERYPWINTDHEMNGKI